MTEQNLDPKFLTELPEGFTAVESSHIFALAIAKKYEDQNLVEVQVIFKDKAGVPTSRYHYDHVPLELVDGLNAAESKGQYFNRVVVGDRKNPRHSGYYADLKTGAKLCAAGPA